ncbi:Nuclear transport factor 2, eukaryote,NTF2-like domain [Cinara cedri]|uniref:Nuclear transport factor 2, eukaryote,NTF2-like domain n=1 Tax=Cinara cedri TaxID=506608 RepID=A0A5E4MPE1_9HEMI|nr:Nuclear transport factor 2, eukaryote,NTF2-like domain [Cinara cedri]
MENSSGVADPTRESRAVAMAKLNSLPRNKYAADIGCEFAELYYSMMRTSPEYANEFYDDQGEFQTVFEDGSAIVVRTRLQVKHILMRPMSACDYIVKSMIPMSCGGSSGGVMVMVTGERFTQNFLLEHRPERMLGYAIVVSLTQYIPEGPVTYNQTPLTTFGGGDSQAITGAEKSVNTSILKKPDYSISAIMDLDFGHAAEVTKNTVMSTGITHIRQQDTAFEFESIPEHASEKTATGSVIEHETDTENTTCSEPTSANIATGNVIEIANVTEDTSIPEHASEKTATGNIKKPETDTENTTCSETACEKTATGNIKKPETDTENTTCSTPTSANIATGNVIEIANVTEDTSIPEHACEKTATGSVMEHETDTENTFIPETASEKTVSENKEPKTANEITTFADPVSLKNTQENTELKPGTDNKKIVKQVINLVLFSAVCWAAYKYLK